MNINDYAPKHIYLSKARKEATQYEGTFMELADLMYDGQVTLVCEDDGSINSIFVDGNHNPIVDTLSGENFKQAYSGKPVMSWVEEILGYINDQIPLDLVEDLHENTLDTEDSEANFDDMPCCCDEHDLPTEVEVPLKDIPDTTTRSLKNYLRITYGHALAKGSSEGMTYLELADAIKVGNIKWGRKLTEAEIEKYTEQQEER